MVDEPEAPPFRGEPATNLSLLADLDEPFELMIELERIARARRGREWMIVANYAKLAVDELRAANDVAQRE